MLPVSLIRGWVLCIQHTGNLLSWTQDLSGGLVVCYQSLQHEIWYLLDPCYLVPYTLHLLLGTIHKYGTWYSVGALYPIGGTLYFTCTCYMVPYLVPYTLYLVLCNPHLFPPLSSVMSAFVQTLPVPPVPGDLPRPDTTCSNGKINRFSFTSNISAKDTLIRSSHGSHGGWALFVQLFC